MSMNTKSANLGVLSVGSAGLLYVPQCSNSVLLQHRSSIYTGYSLVPRACIPFSIVGPEGIVTHYIRSYSFICLQSRIQIKKSL
jgi:hypothetical protein